MCKSCNLVSVICVSQATCWMYLGEDICDTEKQTEQNRGSDNEGNEVDGKKCNRYCK